MGIPSCIAAIPLSLIESVKIELFFSIECALYNVLYEDIDMNINFDYLEINEKLDNYTKEFIFQLPETITIQLLNKYRKYNLNIVLILEKLVLMVRVALYAALNMPIQNRYTFPLNEIIQNISHIYETEIRKDLLIEMLFINFKIAKIQRAWRKYKRLS